MTLNNQTLRMQALLSYVLGAEVSDKLAQHFLQHQNDWDEIFRERLESFAYEFRSDLAVWELEVDARAQLQEKRLSMLPLR